MKVEVNFNDFVWDCFMGIKNKSTEITKDDISLIIQATKNWSQITTNEKEKQRMVQLAFLLEAIFFGVGVEK